MRQAMIAAMLVALAACGGGGSTSSAPSVRFVGNASCPTGGSAGPYRPSPPNVNSQPPVGQAVEEMPHTHVLPPATVQYTHNPPTSGCHYNLGYGVAPIAHGSYDQVIPAEYWVHNLEHGYIVVLYNCGAPGGLAGCAGDFQELRTWARGLGPDPGGAVPYSKVVVLPWPTMTPRFAAVSWDWYDPMNALDIGEVQRFYDNHVNQAPEGAATP